MIDTTKKLTALNVNGVPMQVGNLTTKAITQNGTYNASSDNVDGYSSVTVNVSGGGGTTYTVTYNLTNYTSRNDATEVVAGNSYGTTLFNDFNYSDFSWQVSMGGVRLTPQTMWYTEFTDEGQITFVIPEVTGNIVIYAIGVDPYGDMGNE